MLKKMHSLNLTEFLVAARNAIMLTLLTTFLLSMFGLFNANAEAAKLMVDPSDYSFFGQVFALIKSWGGLESSVRISMVITLIISSIKVSFFKKFWDSLVIKVDGKTISLQILVVPVLSLIIGIYSQGKISFEAAIAYIIMGGGAVYLHEVMDFIKSLPIVNPIVKMIVEIVGYVLGGKKPVIK
jgi:hypothetical protein